MTQIDSIPAMSELMTSSTDIPAKFWIMTSSSTAGHEDLERALHKAILSFQLYHVLLSVHT